MAYAKQMKKLNRAVSKWRKDNDKIGVGGVVITDGVTPCGWCNELRNPEHWAPGCIAVADDFKKWIAIGGNAQDGAKAWEPIVEEVNYEETKQ
jgi:hypothetical protein